MAARRGFWVLLLWVGVAALMFLTGCVDAPSFAGDPAQVERPADGTYPTSYPAARPAADEVVLKWNGTLVVAEDGPAPANR